MDFDLHSKVERAHVRIDKVDARVDEHEVKINGLAEKITGLAGLGAAIGAAIPVILQWIAWTLNN